MTQSPPSVFGDPDFVRYFLSRVLSIAGTIVTLVALPMIVYRSSGSATTTALVAAFEARALPAVRPVLRRPHRPLEPQAGDGHRRHPQRRARRDRPARRTYSPPSPCRTCWPSRSSAPRIGVFFDGAVFGAFPSWSGGTGSPSANSISWAAQSIVEIVVPSPVGVVLAFVHPALLFGFDALTSPCRRRCIAGIAAPDARRASAAPAPDRAPAVRDIREGLRYLVRHAGVRTLTMVGFLQCVSRAASSPDGGLDGPGPRHRHRRLQFGVVYGAWAVGGLAASLALPRLVRRVPAARIALTALPVAAAVGLVVPFITTWWVAARPDGVWGVSTCWS